MELPFTYILIFFCCNVTSHHLEQMKKSSNEKFMVNPKVSRLGRWISIPSRKSARIQSRNREREKSRNVLKVSKPDMLTVDPSSSNVFPFFFI